MAKEATRSRKRSLSLPSASASNESSPRTSSDGIVLRVKLNEGMKRSSQLTKSGKKPKAKQKKVNKKIDAKKPKKPPTAFFYFLEDFRKEFQEQNPDVKSMRDIGKACGEKWKTMTYEEKVQYYDIATEKRAEFDRAMIEYKKKMESGEYEETDEESDFDDV
ncbi:high mobility group B protein 14 isoform X2 [Neltuma alba]|uniref:high mobility group B protein 14 isoform X2 n=1 Tax=Neltuma alba TaxID=207710 RepID=UPI0010A483FA|nr:high mobility group B protein 14 isoform X2 [Prosopis alba]